MAAKTPAERAEERRRSNELVEKEAKLQENLLALLKRQSQEYVNANKKLEQINLQKKLLNEAQKEFNERTRTVDALENNIKKRNQAIIDQKEKIKQLGNQITITAVKNRTFTDRELGTLMDFKRIYGSFINSKRTGTALSADELAILQKVATLRRKTVGLLLTESGAEEKRTRQILQQATIQQKLLLIEEQRIRMIEEENALYGEQNLLAKAIMKDWVLSLPPVSRFRNIVNFIDDALSSVGKRIPFITKLMGGPMLFAGSALLSVITAVYKLFNDLDKAAFVARKEMGMMRQEHAYLRKQAEDLYIQWAHLGVNVESVYKVQKAVTMELGSTLSATKDIVEQAALMSSQFGISEDTTVRMLKTLGQMGQTTASAQLQMVGFAGALSNAAGIPLPQVMEDVAKASETTRVMMAKVPLDMIKAAVEARRMGTTLEKMASSSRKLLNFTESMEAEMEASVLLGRPINLQLARELAYRGKIAESNKEILRLSKQINFERLDPFSMEAFARATGKSVDEIMSMIQADREQNKIRNEANKLANQGNLSLRKQLDLVEQLRMSNKAAAEARGRDYLLTTKQQANQERLTAISNSWKKVITELGYQFLPIIDYTLKIAANLIPLVGLVVRMSAPITLMTSGLGKAYDILVKMTGIKLPTWITGISKALTGSIVRAPKGLGKSFLNLITYTSRAFQGVLKGGNAVLKVINSIAKFFKPITNVILGIGKLASPFAKWVPIVGWVITGVQFIYSLVKRFMAIDTSKGFWSTMLQGLQAVGGALYDVLVKPFVDAWNWIKGLWGGHSPSQIGLSILQGISSVGGMLFESLISPYKKAWEWISSLFGKTTIQPNIKQPAISEKAAQLSVPVDRVVSDKEIKSYRELDKVPLTETERKTSVVGDGNNTEILNNILMTLNKLNDNLMAGNVMTGPINLDGQLISTNMNRGNKFRGNYGAMQG